MKYRIKLRQTVFYLTEIEADTKDEAITKIEALIEEGDDPLDLSECDSDAMSICNIYDPETGADI